MNPFSQSRAWAHFRLIFGTCLILLLGIYEGYAMQPPPPPLDLVQLRILISKADLIVVGKIDTARETEQTVEAALIIEKLLKGKATGKTIAIKEARGPATTRPADAISKDESEPSKMIVANRAGPSFYHGRYKQGMRIVVLLEAIKGTNEYRPLGSGTYDKHLCVFSIENHRIQTFYFQFAEDVKKYAEREERFICFIKKTTKIDARFEREVGKCTRD